MGIDTFHTKYVIHTPAHAESIWFDLDLDGRYIVGAMKGSLTLLRDKQLQIRRRLLRTIVLGLCIDLLGGTDDAGAVGLESGARGYGLTVMEGTRIDTFGVEILGRSRNGALPGRDHILVRLSGLGLEQTGFVQGMSGSPVYVDEKLIGAVSSSWAFADEPVGLLTPIEDMMELLQRDLTGAQQRSGPTHDAESGWLQFGTPLSVSGAGPETLRLLTELLAEMDLEPLAATAGSGAAETAPMELQPGSAVGIQLVGGDLSIAGIGTVTYVDGNHLVAFGHDLVGSGAVDLPLTGAHIHGVLSNHSISFKLGSTTAIVGAARQDRFSGIAAVTDERARTLPMTVEVRTSTTTDRFSFDLARHRFYTTSMAQVSLMTSLESAAKARGDASVRLRLDLALQDGRELSWNRVYTGLSAPVSAALGAGRPLRALVQSAFEDIEVARIDAQVEIDETIHAARIAGARLSHASIAAGSMAQLTVQLVPFRAAPRDIVIPISIPAEATGTVQMRIGSGAAAAAWEQNRWPQVRPGDSDELLQRLAQPALDDELVVELFTEKPGLAVGGRELPVPPPSVQRLLTETHTAGMVRPLSVHILGRQQLHTGYVLQGEHLLTVHIDSKGIR